MIEILRAQPHDSPILKEIALAAKGSWGYPQETMAAWAQTPLISAEAIAADRVYAARLGPEMAGWYRLRLEPPPAMLEDLWVLPAFMGRGIGRSLFQHAVSQAREYNAGTFELDADPHAVAFYERMGCRVTGQVRSEWGRMIPRMRFDLPGEGED